MQIVTESDFSGITENHPLAKQFTVLGYSQGGYTFIPHNFFRNWFDQEAQRGTFYIGKCSALGVGSLVKYDSDIQSLRVGRFVAGGSRLKFLLNSQHETRTISTYVFDNIGMGMKDVFPPQYTDSIIKNDVWLGDEMMMLGGGIIENGCIIGARSLLPPNFRSEPYGIYAGVPARLLRFRFSEKVCEALLNLAWWEMPLTWLRNNNDSFLQDMTVDEEKALAIIETLFRSRQNLK